MGWDDYEPPKKGKKRYKSYKHGFERSRYALGRKDGAEDKGSSGKS
jgi:hypothetical protein